MWQVEKMTSFRRMEDWNDVKRLQIYGRKFSFPALYCESLPGQYPAGEACLMVEESIAEKHK
jgi:hypothetical protein